MSINRTARHISLPTLLAVALAAVLLTIERSFGGAVITNAAVGVDAGHLSLISVDRGLSAGAVPGGRTRARRGAPRGS